MKVQYTIHWSFPVATTFNPATPKHKKTESLSPCLKLPWSHISIPKIFQLLLIGRTSFCLVREKLSKGFIHSKGQTMALLKLLIRNDHLGDWSPEKDCFRRLRFRQPVWKPSSEALTLKMAPAQVVKTSVANNGLSQGSNHPDDHFQSRYVTSGFKPFSYLIE